MSSTVTFAEVEWVRGDRSVSALIRNAGLGITGVVVREKWTITYKPDTIVTEKRVMKALESMIRQSNDANTGFKISHPKVLRISSYKL